MLGHVCILILIDHNIFKSVGILSADIFVLGEKEICVDKQIVEIHGIRLSATVYVSLVQKSCLWDSRTLISLDSCPVAEICAGSYKMVLCTRYYSCDSRRLVCLIVKPHFFDDGLYQTLRIAGIVYRKIASKAYLISLNTQNSRKN